MSEVGLLLFIAALSLIGLIMALFPRRLMEWLDNLEDKLFNRRPVEKAASMADKAILRHHGYLRLWCSLLE
jgi:hypothetical protein